MSCQIMLASEIRDAVEFGPGEIGANRLWGVWGMNFLLYSAKTCVSVQLYNTVMSRP